MPQSFQPRDDPHRRKPNAKKAPEEKIHAHPGETEAGPSYDIPDELPGSKQVPLDEVEEASMASFPASDPPGYITCHV